MIILDRNLRNYNQLLNKKLKTDHLIVNIINILIKKILFDKLLKIKLYKNQKKLFINKIFFINKWILKIKYNYLRL